MEGSSAVEINLSDPRIQVKQPFNSGYSLSISDVDANCSRQAHDGASLRNGVASEMHHSRNVSHFIYPVVKGNINDGVLLAAANEGIWAANIILAQSALNISRILIGIAAIFFYCLDVYAYATCPADDRRKIQHWDMVALGLCVAGILLCIVDCALSCKTPKWRFAAVGTTSSTDQPICIVVVNQGSAYVDHVTLDSAHLKNGDWSKSALL